MVKITVLHNELDQFKEGQSGFSLLIEVENEKILFDTSYAGDIIENAKQANLDLSEPDVLVLSHGHIDHTEGLKSLDLSSFNQIIAHPACLQKKFFPGEGEIGCPVPEEKLKQNSELILAEDPYWIEETKLVFLGQIPRKNEFEGKEAEGYLENEEPDYVKDDSALAIKTDRGLIVISGCAHSGICNIIDYAQQVCQQETMLAVIGGFHLFDQQLIEPTINYFQQQNVKHIYPAHCLSQEAFARFDEIGAERLHTLQELEF